MVKFQINKSYYNLIEHDCYINVTDIKDNILTAIVSKKYFFNQYNNWEEKFIICENDKYQFIKSDDFVIYKATKFEE